MTSMTTGDVLRDAFNRVFEALPGLVDGLSADELSWRPGPQANSIGWLVWHLARVADSHMAELAGDLLSGPAVQVWHAAVGAHGDWHARVAPYYPADAHGYGMTSDQVALFHAEPGDLLGYCAAVHEATLDVLAALEAKGLDRALAQVVDTRWDPPVTAGVRIVSVVNDITQHVGQAAYVKGLLTH